MRPAKRMLGPAWFLAGLVLLGLSVAGLTEEAVSDQTKEQIRRDARDLFESTQYTENTAPNMPICCASIW